jgi:hypothetical protein
MYVLGRKQDYIVGFSDVLQYIGFYRIVKIGRYNKVSTTEGFWVRKENGKR